MFTQRMSKSNGAFSNSKEKSKKESFVSGSLAIKSHASRLKVLTKHTRDEDGDLSQKTASTLRQAPDLNVEKLLKKQKEILEL